MTDEVSKNADEKMKNVTEKPIDIYSNQLRLGVSLSDVSIVFGIVEDRQSSLTTSADKAVVRLAPVTAKQLYLQLRVAIDSYERVLGDIRVPKVIAQQSENIEKKLTEHLNRLL